MRCTLRCGCMNLPWSSVVVERGWNLTTASTRRIGAPSLDDWWSFIRCAPPAGYAERSTVKNVTSAIRTLSAVLLVVSLFAASAAFASSKRVRVPTMKDMAIVWVGGSDANVEYLRLALIESGTGLLTVR